MFNWKWQWSAIATIIGGFIAQMVFGSTIFLVGNMAPYIISALRFHSAHSTLLYKDVVWIFGAQHFSEMSFMLVQDLVRMKIGFKFTLVIGFIIIVFGTAVSAWAVTVNLILMVIVNGCIVGAGSGLSFTLTVLAAMTWYPHRKGTSGGVVLAGQGIGMIMFTQIQTFFINPGDVMPELVIGGDRFFQQPELISRVSWSYLLLSCIYAVMFLVAVVLMRMPSESEVEEMKLLNSDESANESKAAGTQESPAEDHELLARDTQDSAAVNQNPYLILKSKKFWFIWTIFLLLLQSLIFVVVLYKTFGLNIGIADHFLSIVGFITGVTNSVGRVGIGVLYDAFSFRWVMLGLCSFTAALVGTLAVCNDKFMYAVWIGVLFGCNGAGFVLIPAVVKESFNVKFFTVASAVLLGANAIAAAVAEVLSTSLQSLIGWTGVWIVSAAFAAVAALLTLLVFNRVRNDAPS